MIDVEIQLSLYAKNKDKMIVYKKLIYFKFKFNTSINIFFVGYILFLKKVR